MLRLVDGCGALRLGGLRVNWGLQSREGGCDSRGACMRGRGVDGVGFFSDERVGGIDSGFGSVLFHVEGFDPSCLTKCAQ